MDAGVRERAQGRDCVRQGRIPQADRQPPSGAVQSHQGRCLRDAVAELLRPALSPRRRAAHRPAGESDRRVDGRLGPDRAAAWTVAPAVRRGSRLGRDASRGVGRPGRARGRAERARDRGRAAVDCEEAERRPLRLDFVQDGRRLRHDARSGLRPVRQARNGQADACEPVRASGDARRVRLRDSGRLQWRRPDEHANFVGWRQHRKMLPGECA